MTSNQKIVDISKIIGANYGQFWNFKGRYRVVKGGRGSKKSTTSALWFIYHLLKYPKSNLLCVRATYNSLKDSCFAELKKACSRLGVTEQFKFTISPLEITVKSTGQKILFRGFDNPDSITSITVSEGSLCWVWVEEAYEIDDEEGFNKLDFSIRGKEIEDNDLFPQITLTLNPWFEMWIKNRFFDVQDENILALTRNYYHNEFLSDADKEQFHKLKYSDPEGYKIVGLGEWGMPGGRYFSEWRENVHTCSPFPIPSDWRRYVAFDYGLDMFACYFIALDNTGKAWVYKEIYESDLIVSEAINKIKEYTNEEVYSYIAPPDMWNRRQETGKSIADIFSENGICLDKGSNNREQGWLNLKEWLRVFRDEQGIDNSNICIFNNCKNLIRCLPKIGIDEKKPNDVSKEPHELTHSCDALRYFIAGQPVPYNKPTPKPKINFDFERELYNNSIDDEVYAI